MLYYSVVPHLKENTCDSLPMAEIGCAHTPDFFFFTTTTSSKTTTNNNNLLLANRLVIINYLGQYLDKKNTLNLFSKVQRVL